VPIGDIGQAQLSHDGKRAIAFDPENILSGEARIECLPQPGDEQPQAGGPKREPFADEEQQRRAAVEITVLGDHRPGRQNRQQQKHITTCMTCPVPPAPVRLRRRPAISGRRTERDFEAYHHHERKSQNTSGT
jgi:hypothetical protein